MPQREAAEGLKTHRELYLRLTGTVFLFNSCILLFIYSIIHSLHKYTLGNCCVPSIVLNSTDKMVEKMRLVLALLELTMETVTVRCDAHPA